MKMPKFNLLSTGKKAGESTCLISLLYLGGL